MPLPYERYMAPPSPPDVQDVNVLGDTELAPLTKNDVDEAGATIDTQPPFITAAVLLKMLFVNVNGSCADVASLI